MTSSINMYYTNTTLFTNTLQIKFTDLGYAINIGILKRYGLPVSEDKTTWRYYQNMAGIKHITNSDVRIKLIETNQIVTLSKEVLDTYKYSREELKKQGDYYKDLLSKYPEDYLFIKGCIYPVDLETAIKAEEGTILTYDKNYIEYNEYNLISDLETFIKSIYKRYNISDYILTDELYFASFMGFLFSNIPNKIINLRLSKINTNEVHSFHLEQFFRGKLDLWENVSKLNNATKMWLYKNLDLLIKHIGSERTFTTILDKIFNENNIGVGEYVLDKEDITLIEQLDDLTKSVIINNGGKFTATKLNNSYTLDNNNKLSVDTLINLELTTVNDYDILPNAELLDDVVRNETKKINNSVLYKQETKVLDINTVKLFKTHGVDPLLSVIDNWLYLASNNKYTRKLYYTDPNTKVAIEINPLEGFYILIKFLLYVNKNTNLKLTTLNWSRIINSNITSQEDLTYNLFNSEDMEDVAKYIKDNLPNEIYSVNNAEEFQAYMAVRENLYKGIWLLDSNADNALRSGNIKQIVNRLYLNGVVNLTKNGVSYTIDELLDSLGLNFIIKDNFDVYQSIKELVLTFTGINIDLYEDINKDTDNYIAILNKLTSYTLQVVKSVDDVETLYSFHTSNNIIKGKHGVITVTNGEIIDPLERNYFRTKSVGNNFDHMFRVETFSLPPVVESYDGFTSYIEVKNLFEDGNEIFIEDDTNHVTVEIVREFTPIPFSTVTAYGDDDTYYIEATNSNLSNNVTLTIEDPNTTAYAETVDNTAFVISEDDFIIELDD